MEEKLIYNGKRECGSILIISLEISEALTKGTSFILDGHAMQLSELDHLIYRMHKHCPHLNIKMKREHELTIKEMYETYPNILYDILESNGGVDYIAKLLIGYDELYKGIYQKLD